tara:strand:+ start:2186 stop:2473 length:288 start_codon:yes stop_codon:yes gene_type:complete
MNRIINKLADRKFWSPYLTSGVVILIALFLTRCFDIISFEQPETAIAGETISIKLDIEVLEDKFNPGNVWYNASSWIFSPKIVECRSKYGYQYNK